MATAPGQLPKDVDALQAALIETQAELSEANAKLSGAQGVIAYLQLVIDKLDVVPRQRFVTEHVREKFSCRSCEKISQPPAPFHAIARGFAGPSLLAMMILVDNYANHQPLNRQSDRFACEGIGLSVSTMVTLVRSARLNDVDHQACSPMYSRASTITLSTGWTRSCRGTGPPRWSVVR